MSAKEYYTGRRAHSLGHAIPAALYLRVSTAEQNPDLDDDGLRGYDWHAGRSNIVRRMTRAEIESTARCYASQR
jgi:hypothetical protein